MSESIFETYTDERGNISVRVSQEVQVLTREEADRIEAEYKRMQAENAKLRELVRHMNICLEHYEPDGSVGCEHCPLNNDAGNCDYEQRMRELGVTA